MRKFFLLSTVLASAVIAGAASADTNVAVQPFHSVSIQGMGHVTFVHGAQQRVVLKQGDTNNTQVYVKDGDLVFKSCPGKGWFGWNSSCPMGYNLDVVITTPDSRALRSTGAARSKPKAASRSRPNSTSRSMAAAMSI